MIQQSNNDDKNDLSPNQQLPPKLNIQQIIQSNSQTMETQLFQVILSDNKKVTNELRIQLHTIEQLHNDNKSLKSKLNKIFKESQFCLDRDELHMKRNVALNRENKRLKEKIAELNKYIHESSRKFQEDKQKMMLSHQEEKEQLLWQHEKQNIEAVKIQTRFDQQRKECKWLNDENIRLEKLLRSQQETR